MNTKLTNKEVKDSLEILKKNNVSFDEVVKKGKISLAKVSRSLSNK